MRWALAGIGTSCLRMDLGNERSRTVILIFE